MRRLRGQESPWGSLQKHIQVEKVSPALGGKGRSISDTPPPPPPPPLPPPPVVRDVEGELTVWRFWGGRNDCWKTFGTKRHPKPSMERSNSTKLGLPSRTNVSLGVVMETRLCIRAKERDPPIGGRRCLRRRRLSEASAGGRSAIFWRSAILTRCSPQQRGFPK